MRRQHGVIGHGQLIERGLTRHAIQARLARGRLHRLYRGVYAVGRPEVTELGCWMAAVLACGKGAVLSGLSAAALWGIGAAPIEVEVTVPPTAGPSRRGINVRARALRATDVTTRRGIPVTTPVRTLIDLALYLDDPELERAINEADRLDLADPETLRSALEGYAGVAGVRKLRLVLDRRTFSLTDSALEQRFLPIARRAGLPKPLTRHWVNGFRVDFYWPELRLVVETDGLRYHRTPAEQERDKLRDQTHTAAGLRPLRFSHSQIKFEADRVERVLRAVAQRLATRPPYAA